MNVYFSRSSSECLSLHILKRATLNSDSGSQENTLQAHTTIQTDYSVVKGRKVPVFHAFNFSSWLMRKYGRWEDRRGGGYSRLPWQRRKTRAHSFAKYELTVNGFVWKKNIAPSDAHISLVPRCNTSSDLFYA